MTWQVWYVLPCRVGEWTIVFWAQLLTALALYSDLIIDWRDNMSELDAVTYRVDIGLRIGLQPDENLLLKKLRTSAMY